MRKGAAAQRSLPAGYPFLTSLLLLGRPGNAIGPILLLMAGYYFAGGTTHFPVEFSVLIAALFLVHCALTILNDYADYKVDQANGVRTPLTTGSDGDRQRYAWAATIVLLIGIFAAYVVVPSISALLICLLVVLSLVYNFSPLRLSYRPVASIIALGFSYGGIPVAIGYFFIMDAPVGMPIAALVFFWILARMSISILKDFKDLKGDAKHKKKTFLWVFGPRSTIMTSQVFAVVGYVGLMTTIALSVHSSRKVLVAVLATFAVVAYVMSRLLQDAKISKDYRFVDTVASRTLALDGVLLVCLMVS